MVDKEEAKDLLFIARAKLGEVSFKSPIAKVRSIPTRINLSLAEAMVKVSPKLANIEIAPAEWSTRIWGFLALNEENKDKLYEALDNIEKARIILKTV